MTTAQDVYVGAVRGLSSAERLRLAAMILDDLRDAAAPALDYADAWSDEDISDLQAFAAGEAAARYGEDTSLG